MYSRRKFLKVSAVGLGFLGLYHYTEALAEAPLLTDNVFGPLEKDPQGILDLPKGFKYKVISKKGSLMSDGFFLPGKADGMATFKGEGNKVILIRNHEISAGDFENGSFGKNYELLPKIDKNKLYDFGKGVKPGLGGTTTVVYDETSQKVENEYISLAGTIRNCAGGPTPWGSWLTCEETVELKGGMEGALEKDHGYVFEVPASIKSQLAEPIPLKALGRFNHEAVCVDPRTSIVYLTEDRSDGLIYRFIPNQPGKLIAGGKLQVLTLKGAPQTDTRNWETLTTPKIEVRRKMDIEWRDINEVDSLRDDLRYRGFEMGAARFARGEGIWFGKDELYFSCTNGGKISQGQIFRYIPSAAEGTDGERNKPGQLELYLEPNNTDLLSNCDNLTIAPWGDLVICEDRPHPTIVGVKPDGTTYKIGRNVGFESEFAGAVFSPSGQTLFINIQGPGLTFAITGPWGQTSK